MIGNDIVDLKLASIESNWQRRGWLQKIFTELEHNKITNAADSNQMVWKLWSMKEAAYKAHHRRFLLSPRYNPWDFVCTDSSVTINNYQYQTITKHTERYIHTIAYADQSNFISKVFMNKSLQYKSILKDLIADSIGVTSSSIILEKDKNGIPGFKVNSKSIEIAFSLSSHGSFSAFTINL